MKGKNKRKSKLKRSVVFVLMVSMLCSALRSERFFMGNVIAAGGDSQGSVEQENNSQTGEADPQPQMVELDSDKIAQEDEGLSVQRDKIVMHETGNIYFVKCSFTEIAVNCYNPEKDTYEELFSANSNTVDRYYLTDTAVYFGNYRVDEVKVGEKSEYYIRVRKLDFTTKNITEMKLYTGQEGNWGECLNTFAVDSQGRVYASVGGNSDSYGLYLFDEKGTLLDKASCKGPILSFYGFDKKNGNFYYCENCLLEGASFNQDSLMAGNVGQDGKMLLPEASLKTDMGGPAQMISDRYLAVFCNYGEGILLVDSNAYDVQDYTDSAGKINLSGSQSTVSTLKIKNQEIVKLAVPTMYYQYWSTFPKGYYSVNVSANCFYDEKRGTVIAKTDSQMLTEYDIETGQKLASLSASHPIYQVGCSGETCRIIEKVDGKFYMESVQWNPIGRFSLEAPSSLKVGDSAAVSCDSKSAWRYNFSYQSSNPKVLSVDKYGNINAYQAGSVTLTVTTEEMGTTSCATITVEDTSESSSGEPYEIHTLSGEKSNNIHQPVFCVYYHSKTYSFVNPLDNGGFQRVEYLGENVLVETYDSSFNLTETRKLDRELPYFGGFYSGTDENYIVFGGDNKLESSDTEVLRVVKYDKNWNRLGGCSITGANTYRMFAFGNLDMTETSGNLYVHTCHEMFQAPDGFHHQANCTFVIQESDMTLQDSFYGIANFNYGYVSHSFAQLIESDGTNVYRADLGDGMPRGIGFSATKVEEEITLPWLHETLVEIEGEQGENYTGYFLGNMKLSKKYALVTGVGTASLQAEQNNAFIYAVEKDTGEFRRIDVTQYPEKSNVVVLIPKLVSLSGDQFLLLWEEQGAEGDSFQTKMVLINGDGSLASDIITSPLALADDTPVRTADGMVSWYVTREDAVTMVSINPYRLSEVQTQSASVTIFDSKDTDDTSPSPDSSPDVNHTETTKYKKGDIVQVSSFQYKITGNSTVSLKAPVNKKIKKAVIPASVNIEGKTYKVTAIDAKAMKGMAELQTLTIGKNVKTIGQQAFYKCKKLKTVTIQTELWKSVGSKSFSGIANKANIKVPKKKLASYKKLLKKGGVPKTAEIKKK